MADTPPLIDDQNVRLRQCRHGPMLYSTKDIYIGRSLDLYGEFSEGEVHFFGQVLQPGMVAIDVGANIGCHTVFMAKRVGPGGAVIALEPQRIIHQMLCANVDLNRLLNVRALHAAAGAEDGGIAVPDIDYGMEGKDGKQVRVATIDGLALPACHLLKADVEGMEADVIRGATETIKAHCPALYVENDRREKSPDLIELLLGLDCRLYWHFTRLFYPDNFQGEAENVFGEVISMNMIGMPKALEQNMGDLTEITDPADWPEIVNSDAR